MSNGDKELEARLLYRVAELFLDGKTAREVSSQVNGEMHLRPETSRLSVYKLFAKARERGLVRLVPPLEKTITEQVAERYSLDRARLHVVNADRPWAGDAVAQSAADIALDLVKDLGLRLQRPIGIGLGPGRATLEFSRRFGRMLESDPAAPKLKLFAISVGCPPKAPEYDPNSFFNLFPEEVVVERIGMYAEPLVRAREFKNIKMRVGFREVWAKRDEIDVVVTSMGDFQDEDDLLRSFLLSSGVKSSAWEKAGWVGNVQFRPYTEKGPVREKPNELRAVTLFELDDLQRLASEKDHHVLLMARQCRCGMTRARSLQPLLGAAFGRPVFSELVMDAATGRELISSV